MIYVHSYISAPYPTLLILSDLSIPSPKESFSNATFRNFNVSAPVEPRPPVSIACRLVSPAGQQSVEAPTPWP